VAKFGTKSSEIVISRMLLFQLTIFSGLYLAEIGGLLGLRYAEKGPEPDHAHHELAG
jgi:hypothetical protein